jgi:hypothetical protein
MRGYNQANVFVIQLTCHIAIQESDKSSRLTGRTLCVSKKLLYTICDVGHPHKMVFIEPSHIFLDEMVCNQDDSLAFELRSLPGVSKIAIGVSTLHSLAGEVCAKLFGHILWEDFCWIDGQVMEVNIPRSFFSLAAVSTFTPPRGFFCLWWPKGFSSFVSGVVGSCLPLLRCAGVKVALGVGRDAPSAREFLSSFLSLLAWVLFQGLTL